MITINEQRGLLIFMMVIILIFYIILKRRNPVLVKPTGIISGTVTGPDNAPVAGATITLLDANNNVVASVPATPTDGTYTLPAETLGNYHIHAVKANADGSHLQGDVDVTLDAPTKTVDVPMVCFFALRFIKNVPVPDKTLILFSQLYINKRINNSLLSWSWPEMANTQDLAGTRTKYYPFCEKSWIKLSRSGDDWVCTT